MNIIYARTLSLLFFALKIDKVTEKQNSLPPGLRFFIKIAAAAQNGCSFCTDLALANAVKGKIGTEKFKAILSRDILKQTDFSEKERAVFNFVKDYAEIKKASNETFAELQKQFSSHL